MRTRLAWLLILVTALLFLGPAGHQARAQNWVDQGYGEALEGCREGGDVALECHAKKVDDVPKINFIEQVIGPVPGVTTTADIWQRNPEYARKLQSGSLTAQLNSAVIAMFTNPPANTVAFIIDAGQNLGFIPKQTYAQGIGFSGLSPLLPMWKVFRNLAYVILAFILVVVGFMVMLRKKIDPKTVVTVQNALPKIIIALILITFSYALVGILIDLSYLIIFIVYQLFSLNNLFPDYAMNNPGMFTNEGIWTNVTLVPEGDLPWRILFGLDPQGYGAVLAYTAGVLGTVASVGVALVAAPLTGGTSAAVVAVGAAGSFSITLLMWLISIAMLFLTIRLFAFFLGAYIRIIIALLIGPFQIMAEAIPGTNAFASWFKNLVSNIIVFPAGAILFMVVHVFMKLSNDTSQLWHPPFVGLFVNNATSIGTLIAMGLLFAIPSIINQIQDSFKAKSAIQAGPEGLVSVFNQPLQVGMQLGQFIWQKRQMDAFKKAAGGGGGPEPHQK